MTIAVVAAVAKAFRFRNFVTFTAVYVFLSVILVYVLRRQFLETDPNAPRRPGAAPGASRGG